MRDNRNPTDLGNWILSRRALMPHATVCSIADAAKDAQIPDFDPGASTVVETVSAYRAEMVALAEEGDLAARVVCDEHGWAYDSTCATYVPESVEDRNGQMAMQTPRERWER